MIWPCWRRLGFRLDPQYREFLGYANGWPSFFHSVDLFGVDDLADGPRMDVARQMLKTVEPAVFEQAGLDAFEDYVLAMIEYNARELESLTGS